MWYLAGAGLVIVAVLVRHVIEERAQRRAWRRRLEEIQARIWRETAANEAKVRAAMGEEAWARVMGP